MLVRVKRMVGIVIVIIGVVLFLHELDLRLDVLLAIDSYHSRC